jgi:hypothetical protein
VVGSLVAASIDTDGGVIVDHPEGASDIGECEMPDAPCASCADCVGSEACVDGACGDCRTDADCCAPLVCIAGARVTDLI